MLPNELLLCIFLFLQPSLRQRTLEHGDGPDFRNQFVWGASPGDLADEAAGQLALSRIARASKLFRDMALPILYHTIPKTSAKLVDTLSRNASLCELVKVIDIYEAKIPLEVLFRALESIRPRLSQYPAFEARLKKAFRVGRQYSIGALEALHLFLLPNLEVTGHCNMTNHKMRIIRACFKERPVTPILRLRELQFTCQHDTQAHVSSIQQMLKPTVETLRIFAVRLENKPFYPEFPEFQLKHFYLETAVISAQSIEAILERCPSLRTLHIRWGAIGRMADDSMIGFESLGASIRKHGAGLEQLTLDCLKSTGYVSGSPNGRLGPLRELIKLKELVLPQDILVGGEGVAARPLSLSQVLPDSLERLYLLSCQEDKRILDKQICALIKEDVRMNKLQIIQMGRDAAFADNVEALGWTVSHVGDKMVMKNLAP